MICIYCNRRDPPCGFSTEHVVPYALGRFQDNLTLNSEVCTGCNQFFGDTIDRFLTRDSAEAMLRFGHELKDPSEVVHMFTERVTARLPQDGTKWGGVHLRLVPPPVGELEPFVDLVPQVGFKRQDASDWAYFTEGELRLEPNLAERIEADFDELRVILFDTPEAKEHLLQLLEERAIPFKQDAEFTAFEPFETGRVDAELTFAFDSALARAVSKIAFNYLTYMQGPGLVLREEFDLARKFVRYASGKPGDFVSFLPPPEVTDDERNPMKPKGHALAVGWDRTGAEILCKVSPFVHTTYLVRLCKNFGGIWRPIIGGHFFDLEKRQVSKFEVKSIPPWDEAKAIDDRPQH